MTYDDDYEDDFDDEEFDPFDAWYNGGYYHRSYRSEISVTKLDAIVQEAGKTFDKEMAKCSLSLAKMRELGLVEAEKLKASGEIPGPFVWFLSEWIKKHPETDEEYSNRLTANFIRHHVLSYDDVIDETFDAYWLPEPVWTFPDAVWDEAMKAILRVHPELKSAYIEGKKVKAVYNADRFAIKSRYEDMVYKMETERIRQESFAKEQRKKIRQEKLALLEKSSAFVAGSLIAFRNKQKMHHGSVVQHCGNGNVVVTGTQDTAPDKTVTKTVDLLYLYDLNKDNHPDKDEWERKFAAIDEKFPLEL